MGQKVDGTSLAYQVEVLPISATTQKNVQGGRAQGEIKDWEAFEGQIHQTYKVCVVVEKYCPCDEIEWET